jgi:hypothetical protein
LFAVSRIWTNALPVISYNRKKQSIPEQFVRRPPHLFVEQTVENPYLVSTIQFEWNTCGAVESKRTRSFQNHPRAFSAACGYDFENPDDLYRDRKI